MQAGGGPPLVRGMHAQARGGAVGARRVAADEDLGLADKLSAAGEKAPVGGLKADDDGAMLPRGAPPRPPPLALHGRHVVLLIPVRQAASAVPAAGACARARPPPAALSGPTERHTGGGAAARVRG